ncbi:competence protein ComA [Desulfosporosinus sp. PR]|uniref:competence protein ComA n=1 Tax=Candidatus Desulfosporosinus nitrosoreducens TaxID=3401928 RepID=UPI0027EE6EBF|nr:competence protein ComA [Desulfosporosinus sp. PR]MDQ7095770.1 competence protein ComA [Desulfosporosinus sp. PR]
MGKESVIYEITDCELRVFKFPLPVFKGLKLKAEAGEVSFERISISGVIEQGIVQDESALLSVLTKYCTEHSCKCHQACLAIPLQTGIVRSYTIPWLSKRDRRSAISLLAAEEMPSQSDLIYDYAVLAEEKPKSLKLVLGAVRKSILQQYVAIFKRADIEVVGINFSLAVLGQSLGFEFNEDVLYLEGESQGLQAAIFRGIIPESLHRLRSPQQWPGLFPEQQNGAKTDEPLEQWENEIRRFLLYHKTQHPDLNFQRLVWSGDLRVERLAQALLGAEQVSSVENIELKSVPEAWQKVLAEYKGHSEVAVGYGLLILSHRPVLNLWRRPRRERAVERRYQVLALVLCGLFFLGNIIWCLFYVKSLSLEKEVEVLAGQGAKIEAGIQQQNDLEAAWNKVKIHSGRIGEDLAQVQALSGQELEIEQIVFKQGTMSLRGKARTAQNVEALIQTLRAMGWDQPALSSYQSTALNNIEFSLTAKQRKMRLTSDEGG